MGAFNVPLKTENGLERLRAVERDFLDYDKKGLNKISKRFIMNFFRVLPSKALKYAFEANPGLQSGFTALLGSTKEYSLNGNPVLSIHPLIGTAFDNVGKEGGNHCYSSISL